MILNKTLSQYKFIAGIFLSQFPIQAFATDWNAISNGLQQIQQILEKSERDKQQRLEREQQKAALQQEKAQLATQTATSNKTCNGTFNYLGNKMPQFTAPELVATRNQLLNMSIADALGTARSQGATPESALQQAEAFATTAMQAAQTADSTDGGGGSIQKVKNGTLALNWPCEGIHSAAVCAYIANTWGEISMREMASLMKRCN